MSDAKTEGSAKVASAIPTAIVPPGPAPATSPVPADKATVVAPPAARPIETSPTEKSAPPALAKPSAPAAAKPVPAASVAAKPVPAKPKPVAAPVVKSQPVKPVSNKPAAPAITPPVAPASIAAKDTKMNDTINTATDKTQAMFADVSERSKGAMDKGKMIVEEMSSFSKGNIEAIVESSKIAAKGIEAMTQDAASYAKTSFEGATQAMKTMATVKSPADLMKLQSDYMRTAFDALVAQTSRSTEAMMKLAGDVAQPLSSRMALAADKVKIAA